MMYDWGSSDLIATVSVSSQPRDDEGGHQGRGGGGLAWGFWRAGPWYWWVVQTMHLKIYGFSPGINPSNTEWRSATGWWTSLQKHFNFYQFGSCADELCPLWSANQKRLKRQIWKMHLGCQFWQIPVTSLTKLCNQIIFLSLSRDSIALLNRKISKM